MNATTLDDARGERVARRAWRGLPRGLLAGTAAALGLVWGMYAIWGGGAISPIVQSAIYLALGVITVRSRRAKIAIVRSVQRFTINPLMRLALWIGVNPLGLAILETRGHRSGRLRRTPVGNGRRGDAFWIIAEHGERAGYVRNLRRGPHVRVRLRIGLRYRWVPGVAEVLPDDDALARQRRIIRWHPLRALNAINVRVLGADLLTVRVRLRPPGETAAESGEEEAGTSILGITKQVPATKPATVSASSSRGASVRATGDRA
jgi:deazaflavin-dependent oxidoreductase (nitroreductase family)